MDEKTEELRDIFMSVSDEETVTETQAETRGSLVDGEDDEAVAERLRELVAELREAESFGTDLDEDTYVELVRAFYEEGDDDAIAERLGLPRETVFRARLDLHLLRESDTGFDVCTLRRNRDADDETLAAELGVDVETLRRYRRVVAAQDAVRAANHRYQREFDELLTDADLAGHFTDAVQDDGLREAAEDIETDVSF
ncbi:MAG: conditioned medium-induced protein 4 [Haloarculaceae archaeon]